MGYAWDRFLLYVKGGGAWERDDYAVLIGGFNLATVAETRGGWTLGLGGEYAFLDFITGFIEYDFYGMVRHQYLRHLHRGGLRNGNLPGRHQGEQASPQGWTSTLSSVPPLPWSDVIERQESVRAD